MKLSLSLIMSFIIISPVVWSQGTNWNPEPGLVQIEKKGDNTKLIFEFECQNRRGQATSCKKEVEDKDGLASLVAVQSVLKQHYVCSSSNSNDTIPHWENIKPFIESRLELLLKRCHEALCDTSSERITYCSNQDYRRRNEDRCRRDSEFHTQINSQSGSDNSKNKMEFCGDLVTDYEGIQEALLSSDNPTYSDLNKLGDFLSKHEPYYKYKVKTDFDQGKDYDAREHILSDTISSNENYSDNLIAKHHKRFGGQENSLRFTGSTNNRTLTLSREDNNCPTSDTSTEVSAHLHQLITNYNSNNRRSFWRRRATRGVR